MPKPLEQLEPLVHCPVCNKKYRGLRMLPVAEEDRRTTLHLTCEYCGGKTLVSVAMTQFGMMSFGILTDLDQSEAKRLLQADPVSADHVIAAHQFLKDYRGSVEDMLK